MSQKKKPSPPKRVPIGPRAAFGGELENDKQFRHTSGRSQSQLREYRNMAEGLPYIKLGAEIFYHVPTALEWFKSRQITNSRAKNKGREA